MTLQPQETEALANAKRLLRLARTGALATLDAATGRPLTTLVGVASDWDGAPLFLMSELAQHTKNLNAQPTSSLLLTSEGGRGDPLNHPRVTLTGSIAVQADPTSKARYLRRNPKAKLYASFTDFTLRRLAIEEIHYNGGFGKADRVEISDLLTAPGDLASLIAAEDELLDEVDALGDEVLARLAEADAPGRRVWRAAGLDAEGVDLSAGTVAARVAFPTPVFDPQGWRSALRAAVGAV